VGRFLADLPAGPGANPSRSGRLRHYFNRITEEMRNLDEQVDLESLLLTLRTHIAYLGRGEVHGFARQVLYPAPNLIGNDEMAVLDGVRDLELGVKEYIHRTYGLSLSESKYEQATDCYRELGRSIDTPFALFTTNYDPVAESVPGMIGRSPLDGFRKAWEGAPETWDPTTLFEFDVLRHLPVFHLHGSASWFQIDGEIRRYPGLGLGANRVRSMLVYPGEAKDDLDSDQSDVSRHAYNYLAQSASKQGLLLAIGYSFRDAAVRRVLQLAAGYRQKRIRLIILAPSLDGHAERLLEEPHIRGEFVNGEFQNFDMWSPIIAKLVGDALAS